MRILDWDVIQALQEDSDSEIAAVARQAVEARKAVIDAQAKEAEGTLDAAVAMARASHVTVLHAVRRFHESELKALVSKREGSG